MCPQRNIVLRNTCNLPVFRAPPGRPGPAGGVARGRTGSAAPKAFQKPRRSPGWMAVMTTRHGYFPGSQEHPPHEEG
jgi:hypothetical protein